MTHTKKTLFVGIDYSMTSPGICVRNDNIHLFFFTSKKKWIGQRWVDAEGTTVTALEYQEFSDDITRFENLATQTIKIIESFICEPQSVFIGIEGYSFASTGSRVFQIAENGGILKHFLKRSGYNFETIPPTQVKKLATGMGNSKKEPVYEAFVKKTKCDLKSMLGITKEKVDSPLSDMADAFWISEWAINLDKTIEELSTKK